MKHFILMCLLLFIHTSQSHIYNLRSTEGADVFLICKHEGKVLWSKDRDRSRKYILTAECNKEITKLCADLHNRYSVLGDLSLHINNLSVSDSGIYYCNANPTVNLTVTAPDISSATSTTSRATTPPSTDLSTTSTRSSTKTKRAKKTKHILSATSTTSSIIQPDATTPDGKKYPSLLDERKATTGSIHRHAEDSTPAPDSSTAFTYYCIKEN